MKASIELVEEPLHVDQPGVEEAEAEHFFDHHSSVPSEASSHLADERKVVEHALLPEVCKKSVQLVGGEGDAAGPQGVTEVCEGDEALSADVLALEGVEEANEAGGSSRAEFSAEGVEKLLKLAADSRGRRSHLLAEGLVVNPLVLVLVRLIDRREDVKLLGNGVETQGCEHTREDLGGAVASSPLVEVLKERKEQELLIPADLSHPPLELGEDGDPGNSIDIAFCLLDSPQRKAVRQAKGRIRS
mmetsp:Transcript_2164/g.4986  ORF Transcript_2164/g.4986 Transcript_2164/m.4986 type:complete len:245 (-) Transcript_2164:662-1396(-)